MENTATENFCKKRSFSQSTINSLSPVFKLFDYDNKNYITENDLTVAMAASGFHPTKSEVKEMINNPEGKIDFEQFVELFQEKCNVLELAEDDMLASFKVFDRDGNGVISRDELREVLKSHIDRLTDEDIDEIMNEADINNDGEIDFAEYVAMCKAK